MTRIGAAETAFGWMRMPMASAITGEMDSWTLTQMASATTGVKTAVRAMAAEMARATVMATETAMEMAGVAAITTAETDKIQ